MTERHRASALIWSHYAFIFFDIIDGENLPDLYGSDHADLAAARVESIRYSGKMLREMPGRFWNAGEWIMTVSDAKKNSALYFEVPCRTDALGSMNLGRTEMRRA